MPYDGSTPKVQGFQVTQAAPRRRQTPAQLAAEPIIVAKRQVQDLQVAQGVPLLREIAVQIWVVAKQQLSHIDHAGPIWW